ncbi:MAG: hypothetical protein M5U11_04435 [Anaerolineales bacterium]|jgi:hypothetical protein|nr:hypothetical protein [Anaerolineales bacterium]MCC7511908.1 hypothetical protein [Anaerolineae bacterium]MBW7918639.1 hypothetical protein [Anaerolineales bacterium]MCZ2288523.1 hypothetical protein [Anaerolineales bacterium]MCZ7548388.1 hypothetical protein [Anaerolineales bacterium]
MNMPKAWFLRLRTGILLLFALLSVGCNTNSTSADPSENIVALSKHYQQYSDYQSLVSLLPYLNTLTMRRGEMEQLLGAPSYCPRIDTCWYSTEKAVPAMCPEGSKMEDNTCYILTSGVEIAPLQFQLVLMVTYELAEPGTGLTKASDRLIQFELRPVGE